MRGEEEDKDRLRAPLLDDVMQRRDVSDRLRHLLADEFEQSVVHPETRKLAACGLRLRALVLVMRKEEVEPTQMDLEAGAKELLRHRGALDVPAWATATPGRVPRGVLAFLGRLPEGEVARVLFERARVVVLELVRSLPGQATVVGEASDAEVNIAAGLVCIAVANELFDQRDDLRDRLRRLRLMVGPAETESLGVLDVPLRGLHRERATVPGCGVVDLVVDVRDVRDERDVVAALREPASQPHRDHKRPRVADMDALVHGRSARVHTDRARRGWKLLPPPCQRVIELHRSYAVLRHAEARRSRPRARDHVPVPSALRGPPSDSRPRPSTRARVRARRAFRSRARRARGSAQASPARRSWQASGA